MKQIIVGIASLPDRVDCLKDTVNSLYNQADKIIIGLNNYKQVPEFLIGKEKIETYLLDNKLGDAAKFYKIDEYPDAYYFAADDDLIYPQDFTQRLISKIKEYGSIVGLHGVIMQHPIQSYYVSRKVLHGLHSLNNDVKVDLVATCSCAFDTKQLKVSLVDFKTPNMADVWLADLAKKQNINAIVISRENNWVSYNKKMVENKFDTIFDSYLRTRKDEMQTKIAHKWEPLK